MLSALAIAMAVSSMSVPSTPDEMKMQIVPMSQNPFDRKQTILECTASDPYGIFLLNDLGVSDKAYEAVVNNPISIQMVKLIRKEANGSLIAWTPDGKTADVNPKEIGEANIEKMEIGEVSAIMESPYANTSQQFATGQPVVDCTTSVSRQIKFLPGGKIQRLSSLGIPTGKFANIKCSIRIIQVLDSFSAAVGSTKTLEDVTFKVVGPIPDQTDKKEHMEVVQSGIPNLGSFSLFVNFDWAAYEKDNGPVKNKSAQSSIKIIRKPGETLNAQELRLDLGAALPLKYWSKLTVYRNSSIQGYFGRVAIAPRD